MAEPQGRSRKDVEAQIIAKAWSDEAFMEELRTNPRAAIEKELGMELPEDAKVEVHVESAEDKTFHLVIPSKPTSDELSDEQLEAAAGGVVPICIPERTRSGIIGCEPPVGDKPCGQEGIICVPAVLG